MEDEEIVILMMMIMCLFFWLISDGRQGIGSDLGGDVTCELKP